MILHSVTTRADIGREIKHFGAIVAVILHSFIQNTTHDENPHVLSPFGTTNSVWMASSPTINNADQHLLVSYQLDEYEKKSEAIVNAFHAANIDVFEESTTLGEWINPDVIEAIQWNPDRPVYLSARIWDHRVILAPEEVRIYTI